MTCDDVFDILTRGPFPSGAAEDESVQRHLALPGMSAPGHGIASGGRVVSGVDRP